MKIAFLIESLYRSKMEKKFVLVQMIFLPVLQICFSQSFQ